MSPKNNQARINTQNFTGVTGPATRPAFYGRGAAVITVATPPATRPIPTPGVGVQPPPPLPPKPEWVPAQRTGVWLDVPLGRVFLRENRVALRAKAGFQR